jgi:AcrR family transcriptional regulator
MPGQQSTEEKILKAAKALIRAEGWAGLSMRGLAREAGLSLAALYAHVPSRAALIALFLRESDLKVLAQRPTWTASERPRDRVFDIIMTRFESHAAERDVMRALAQGLRRAPLDGALALPALAVSMQWMLEAAEVQATAAASTALALVYASVLPIWAEDDDPGLAKTMAALDRRLRRIEQLFRDRAPTEEAETPAPPAARKKRKRKK